MSLTKLPEETVCQQNSRVQYKFSPGGERVHTVKGVGKISCCEGGVKLQAGGELPVDVDTQEGYQKNFLSEKLTKVKKGG